MQGATPTRVRESRTPLELAWRRFKRSRVGIFGGVVLIVLYLIALFSQFLAPYSITATGYVAGGGDRP